MLMLELWPEKSGVHIARETGLFLYTILGGLVMHKRARNHKHYVYCERADKFFKRTNGLGLDGINLSNWKIWACEMHQVYDASNYNYEPQGKREAKKFGDFM